MALPTIFCPQCDALVLDAVLCPACHWRRPVAVGEVGKPIWAVALEAKLPSKGSHPVAVNTFVYIPTDKEQIVALDTAVTEARDAIKWRYRLDPRYRCYSVAVWDEYLLPGTEYIGGFPAPQGELLLLSAENGDEVWRHPVEGASLSVPTVHEDVAFFTVNTGWLYAVDLAARQELWRRELPDSWSWAPAAPLLTPTGLLILPSRSDQLMAFDLEKKKTAWTFPAEGWFPYTPVWVDGMIYTRCWDRHIYALDASNGQTVWQHKAPRDYSSDLWVDDKYLYIGVKDYQGGAESGARAYALYTLDRQTGQRLDRYEVKGHILARPVATEEAVLFATDDRSREIDSQGTLYALDTRHPQNQQLLWEPGVVEQRFQSDLLPVGDLVIAGTRQGAVYAIRWQAAETTPEAPSVYVARGAWEEAAIAHALRGEYVPAAEIYAQQLQQPLRAGWLYFHAGEHRRVIELLGQSEVEAEKTLAIGAVHALPGAKERARILRDMGECLVAANAYKEAGDWVGAGDCYREAQAWEEARAAYARAGAWEQWSELTGELEKWEDLVERYLQTGEYVQAAEIYAEKLGLFLEAADCYDRANLHPEAFAAYCRVSPEKMTEAAQRRLADLAEEMGEVDVALETYQALGELTKAAQLAETSERYEQALAFYQEIGPPLKVAEMLEKLARYAEAAEVFMQNELWGRAALSLEKQVEQELERLGGVRHARRNEQLQAWLQRAVELFEDEGEVADSEKDRDFFYRGARRCRNKLAQLKREPLLKVSVETERLIVDQSSVVRCVVENVGWGTARNLTLNVSSPHLKYPIDPIRLGDLRRGEQVSNVCSVVPNIAGDLVLQVKFRGRTRSGEERDFPMAGGNNVTLNTQARLEARPEPEAELGSLWEESDTGSTEEPDSGVVFQTELELQEVESLKRRLARHHANLNKLQEQASLFGAGRTPLDLLNQIEAEEQAIVEVEERLQELKG